MAYIDSLQKVSIQVNGSTVECVAASYKGVPFFFEDASYSGGGRNVQTNSIPFSDNHVNEDTGKGVAKYSFNIYFLGEDAESKKNAFLKACNEAGPGELVHPYFGVFNARCEGGVNLSYNNLQEYISGSVTFVPENDFEIRNVEVSLSGKTRQKAGELRKVSAAKFQDSFKTSGKKKSILDNAVEISRKAVDAAYSCRKVVQRAAEYVRMVGRIKSNIQAIILAPGDFVARFQNLVTMSAEILGIDADKKDSLKNALDLMSFSLPFVDEFHPQIAANKMAMVSLVRMTAASSVAENLVECEFSSVDEAEQVQDDVYDAFEKTLSETDDPELYVVVQELEASALKYLRDGLSNIPYEVDVDIPATNNLLSVVYGVYGSLDLVESVFERNGYRDPLMIKPSDGCLVLCND